MRALCFGSVLYAVAATGFLPTLPAHAVAGGPYKVGDRVEYGIGLQMNPCTVTDISPVGLVLSCNVQGVGQLNGLSARPDQVRPVGVKSADELQTQANAAAVAQRSGPGAAFGARNPAVCKELKTPQRGAISPARAAEIFKCEKENVDTNGDNLNLVASVKVEVAADRPYYGDLDANDPNIDPRQAVYPIRGSFIGYRCVKLGLTSGNAGKNCLKSAQDHAVGACYRDAFADWHCLMADGNAKPTFIQYPPPEN